jgi:hypothetical protein
VLSRVTPEATTWCQPKLTLTAWTIVDGFRFPRKLTAVCGDSRVRYTVTRPYVVRLIGHALTESIGKTDTAGSIAIIEHLAPLSMTTRRSPSR